MKQYILTLILLPITLFSFAQDHSITELPYEVNTLYPPLSISKAQLAEAQTITDLNRFYKTSWVRTYQSVEVLASHQGIIKKAISKNDTLSQEQKALINGVDVGTNVTINVLYLPENTLTHNEMKEFHFKFMVNPETEATYIGGAEQLNQYFKENAIDKIPKDSFIGYDLAAVKFTIDEAGQIINAQVFESSKDEKIDELLVGAICNMPSWKPAEYANGQKVKQEFVLMVGNMKNCIVYTLNIQRDWDNVDE